MSAARGCRGGTSFRPSDAQSRSLELFEQLRAGPQAQMLRQVGKDQPPLAARLQMLWQLRRGIRAASGCRDRRFRFPWASSAARESTAGCRPRAPRGLREKDPPARHRCAPKARAVERSRAHTPARADRDRSRPRVRCHAVQVPRRARRCPCRYRKQRWMKRTQPAEASCDEIHVLTADRREDTEVRMNSAACFRNLDAFRAPLVRTDHAEQRSQRCDRCSLRGTEGLRAGLPDIGRSSQRNRVVVVERDQQRVQRARPLRPGLPVEMECVGRIGDRSCG